MKILTFIMSLVAIGLIVFNATKLDFDGLFKGNSMIAVITILASLCVILMMLILNVSKQIEEKVKKRH